MKRRPKLRGLRWMMKQNVYSLENRFLGDLGCGFQGHFKAQAFEPFG
jgi:hypothetical protein